MVHGPQQRTSVEVRGLQRGIPPPLTTVVLRVLPCSHCMRLSHFFSHISLKNLENTFSTMFFPFLLKNVCVIASFFLSGLSRLDWNLFLSLSLSLSLSLFSPQQPQSSLESPTSYSIFESGSFLSVASPVGGIFWEAFFWEVFENRVGIASDITRGRPKIGRR